MLNVYIIQFTSTFNGMTYEGSATVHASSAAVAQRVLISQGRFCGNYDIISTTLEAQDVKGITQVCNEYIIPKAKEIPGPPGPKGDKGDSLKFEDLTPEQKEELRGPKGDKGDKGDRGDAGSGGGISFEIGETLKLQNNILDVNTTDDAITDNTLPITSGGVDRIVGNIQSLLELI